MTDQDQPSPHQGADQAEARLEIFEHPFHKDPTEEPDRERVIEGDVMQSPGGDSSPDETNLEGADFTDITESPAMRTARDQPLEQAHADRPPDTPIDDLSPAARPAGPDSEREIQTLEKRDPKEYTEGQDR